MREEKIKPYSPDYQLSDIYREANLIGDSRLEELCPSFCELSDVQQRYRDESVIGKGSIKEVSKAYDTQLKRWVALARLRDDRGPESYDKFVQEGWLIASLSHSNIITIYDIGVGVDGRPFFSMALKNGATLEDVRSTKLSELLNVFAKVCDAVAYAHSKGVLHLDLKPSNIQVDEFGEVMVFDWGLARSLSPSVQGADDATLDLEGKESSLDSDAILFDTTLRGRVKGTLGFMAPEQADPAGENDERTDIFAMGCILYQILTGEIAFTGVTRDELLAQAREASIIPPSRRFPALDIPISLEAIVLKATSASPDDRYRSMIEMKADLERYRSGYTTGAERFSLVRNARKFIIRNAGASIVVIILAATMIAISAFFSLRINHQFEVAEYQKERAAKVEAEITVLESEFQFQLEKTERSRAALAHNLALSADSMKNLAIHDQPIETVQKAKNLVQLALELDPDCARARLELIALNILQLNMAEASKIPKKGFEDHLAAVYPKIADEYAEFSFGRVSRPTVSQLAGFLRDMSKVRDVDGLMDRIVIYDHAARSDKGNYGPVVEALIAYHNPDWKDPEFIHNPRSKSLILRSSTTLDLRFYGRIQERSILSLLNLDSLKLKIDKPMNISGLGRLPISRLDLRGCQLIFDTQILLPNLSQIDITAGSVDPQKIRDFILSSRLVEVIEHE